MTDQPPESKNFINLGVVFDGTNKVLLIRRAEKETGSDGAVLLWAFPGGKQRFGESRTECVKRKILVRTGYDIKSIREISMRVHPQFKVTVVYHLCELNAPEKIAEPSEPHEVAEIQWVAPEEVQKMFTTDLDPDVQKVLFSRVAKKS